MTSPFRPISSASSASVPERCDMTLYLSGGRRYHMRVEHPMVKVEREDRYDDVYSFGVDAPMRYTSSDHVTVTIEGRLGDAHDMIIGARQATARQHTAAAATPAPQAPAPASTWSNPGVNPVDDVRTWARRMREEATDPPATAVRSLADLPELGDLVKEIGDAHNP